MAAIEYKKKKETVVRDTNAEALNTTDDSDDRFITSLLGYNCFVDWFLLVGLYIKRKHKGSITSFLLFCFGFTFIAYFKGMFNELFSYDIYSGNCNCLRFKYVFNVKIVWFRDLT